MICYIYIYVYVCVFAPGGIFIASGVYTKAKPKNPFVLLPLIDITLCSSEDSFDLL